MIDRYDIIVRITEYLNQCSDEEYVEEVNRILGTEYTIDDLDD